ncbi:chromate transporter [Advenella kashmirensis W13003]|uniref:Chromate transporter n=1 Tax=Advenella kashmirensis W13003 TaxID=1424334 RepID=V8QVC7_9BURK|nr:chromate transporter [Advenella kashmirensis W13003]
MFRGFAKIGLLGFGGVGPIARHVIVREQKWLSEKDYATLLGVGKVLPGANTVNVAVMLGDRYHGMRGSIVAVSGLLVLPMLVLIVLAVLYQFLDQNPYFNAALQGSACAAAGMVIGMGLKMASKIDLQAHHIVAGLATIALVVWLKFSLLQVVAVMMPLAIVANFILARRHGHTS